MAYRRREAEQQLQMELQQQLAELRHREVEADRLRNQHSELLVG